MSSILPSIKKYLVEKFQCFNYLSLKRRWNRYNASMKDNDIEFALTNYRERTGEELNLNNPQKFNEKLWYLKLYYRNPLMTICSDKYKVREYVKECGLKHILNEIYDVYDDAKDIDFDNLPANKVFFKCNHTSGYNAIYDKNKKFDKKNFIRKFNFILKQNYYHVSREWNYRNIEPKIICEKVLDINGLLDYRFFCFKGKARLLCVDSETCADDGSHFEGARRNVYDRDMNFLNFTIGRENFPLYLAPRPNNFEEMREYAETLSKPFPCVRVDFYNINQKIYFGEMTFYHGGCCQKVSSKEWDIKLGSWIDISCISDR